MTTEIPLPFRCSSHQFCLLFFIGLIRPDLYSLPPILHLLYINNICILKYSRTGRYGWGSEGEGGVCYFWEHRRKTF